MTAEHREFNILGGYRPDLSRIKSPESLNPCSRCFLLEVMLTKPRIPLLQRRGGRAHQTLEGAAGVVRNIFDHPVCSALEWGLSLLVAATPPLEEGSTKRMTHLAFYFGQLCSMSADVPATCEILGGRRPPLQRMHPIFSS